ncbi:ash family protein [Salmonella enterica subsp. enterica serovar Brandenburg]|nr:ash family protein [Salmonella enterica]EBM5554582.1 ash family protein [Salmonella enterica]EEB4926586.1 ash family protein [Salmonella enterica subsp. enterica serovar Brandenburg]
MQRQLKKSLNAVIAGCYIALAAIVLAVGHLTPLQLPATQSAARAFFIVATFFAIERQIMVWCTLFSTCRAAAVSVLHSGVHLTTMSMVAQAGQLSGWPVSGNAGSEIPVWAIASEHLTSCDSMINVTRGCHNGYNPKPKTPKIRDPPTQLRLSP